jgi:hypothetical protein
MQKIVAGWISTICCALLLSQAANAGPPSEEVDCNPPSRWETVAEAAEGRVLFVGEVHGNTETPAAFARYVCAAASRAGSTLVLLELPPHHAPAIREAMASDDPRTALLSGLEAHWKTRDGRGSVAMLDMMGRLMSLAKTNPELSIEPFSLFLLKEFTTPEETMAWAASLSADQIQEQSEAGMAQEIRRRSAGYDRTIVLVGNVHAYLAVRENSSVPSAAMRVPGALSLRVVHDGGESWIHGKEKAGIHSLTALNPNAEPTNAMGLSARYAPHFSGFLSVGPISASPPALPETP